MLGGGGQQRRPFDLLHDSAQALRKEAVEQVGGRGRARCEPSQRQGRRTRLYRLQRRAQAAGEVVQRLRLRDDAAFEALHGIAPLVQQQLDCVEAVVPRASHRLVDVALFVDACEHRVAAP